MSETTTDQDVQQGEQAEESIHSTPSLEQSPTPETDTQQTDTTETAFDASDIEDQYGMPAGSLSEAKDEESALAIVAEHADKILTAGLLYSPKDETEDAPATPKSAATDESGKKAAPSGNEAIDALRAELSEVKTELQQRKEQETKAAQEQEQQMVAMLNQRAAEEIDKWESSTYGKHGARNYNQLRAFQELNGLVQTHVKGLAAQGKPIPTVEKVMRQVRAFHSKDKPPTNSKPAEAKPLGTPGGSKPKGDNEPRSIHHAYSGGF